MCVCTVGSYASLSVCDLTKVHIGPKFTGIKSHIMGTVQVRVTKFGQSMEVDDLNVDLEGQGYRSNAKVIMSKT